MPMHPENQKWLAQLREYHREFFGCLPASASVVYRGAALGAWLANTRHRALRDGIPADLATALKEIDPNWLGGFDPVRLPAFSASVSASVPAPASLVLDKKSSKAIWQAQLNLLRDFIEERGRIPIGTESFLGVRIGRWVRMQLQDYADGRMLQARVEALESIRGWSWTRYAEQLEVRWQSNLETLRGFVEAHERLPTRCEEYGGVRIGKWVHAQRAAQKGVGRGRMTPERTAALSTIRGWYW